MTNSVFFLIELILKKTSFVVVQQKNKFSKMKKDFDFYTASLHFIPSAS